MGKEKIGSKKIEPLLKFDTTAAMFYPFREKERRKK